MAHHQDPDSPNAMMVDPVDDATHVVDVNGPLDRDSVTEISPDTLADDTEPTPPVPLATDYDAIRELVLTTLQEEPKVLEDACNTWTVENWRSLSKKEHGPTFQAGGFPWRILLFPHGNNTSNVAVYLEHGFEPDKIPEDWSCCVQFALVLWNPNDPSIYAHHTAHHRFTKDEGDWGFTRFQELSKLFNVPYDDDATRPLIEDETANITAYVRILEDETGVMWHSFANYDSKKETGYVGLKNQGATCYLNSLLQSLYFTNAFRKAIYQIPTEQEESINNSAYTLQRLFYQLQTSSNAVGTAELTKSFGWETRHIFEQQDVQELSRKLMERMEEKMKGTEAENLLPRLFSGKIKTYISCIHVKYESSRIEDFWDVQLNVSKMGSLLNSFQDYVSVEKMEGENKYFAGDEYKLQEANKGVIFMGFPDVLHLQLKRFEYDFTKDAMAKVNDRYEFPEVFDAAPYLSEDADKSEPWIYQLHGVLVHSGDLNAGHYYAFLKPEKDGWFYKYDDDKVTRATKREVLEDNFGGPFQYSNGLRPQGQKKVAMRPNSAYMLVYFRQSRLDKILTPVTHEDIPSHIETGFVEEASAREAKRKEREEQHLYRWIKAVTPASFQAHNGFDLTSFDAASTQTTETTPAAPKMYKVLRTATMEQVTEIIAKDLGHDPAKVRLWLMVGRQNKTIRPDQPIMDLRPTLDETYSRLATQREDALRLWVEVAEDAVENGEAVWPTYQGPSPTGVIFKNDLILLFVKCFDAEAQSLRGLGHVYISREKKVDDLIPFILKKIGLEKLPSDEKVLLWEEIKPGMIECLKGKQSLKAAELQDGDIICVQRKKDTGSQNFLEKRLSGDSRAADEISRKTDNFEDAKEYYEFLVNRKTIKFNAHPSKCDANEHPPFEMVLNSKMTYDQLVEKLGDRLGVPSTHLRLWTLHGSTGLPRTAVKRGPQQTVNTILSPTGFNQLNSAQRNDALYFEILDMSLAELDTKKNVKITWLSEGIVKEEHYDLLVTKSGIVEDIIEALVKKAKIKSEEEAGEIRLFEVNGHKFTRELPREYPVISLNDYLTLVAERVPEEELEVNEPSFVYAFHFQSEPNRMHGMPFKFLLKEGEPFLETKKRLEKRTAIRGKNFEKIKFAIVRRSSYSRPHYLNDDDVLWDLMQTEDEYLALDHADRSRSLRNGVGDLFLK